MLDPRRVTPELHADTVAIYCQAYGSLCEANDKLASMGALVKTGSDNRVIPNPYLAVREQAEKTMLSLSAELGIAPGPARRPLAKGFSLG